MQGKRIIRGVILVLMTMFTIALSSCDSVKNHFAQHDSVDSTFVADYVNNYTNPQMFSVDEAWTLKALIEQKMDIDNVFVSMSDEVIENVVAVLLKRQPEGVYKLDIVNEYLMHRDIYDNLPKSQNATLEMEPSKIDRTGTDLGNRPDTAMKFKVDTAGNTVTYKVQKE